MSPFRPLSYRGNRQSICILPLFRLSVASTAQGLRFQSSPGFPLPSGCHWAVCIAQRFPTTYLTFNIILPLGCRYWLLSCASAAFSRGITFEITGFIFPSSIREAILSRCDGIDAAIKPMSRIFFSCASSVYLGPVVVTILPTLLTTCKDFCCVSPPIKSITRSTSFTFSQKFSFL